jgi:hypothetical protein
MSRPRSARALAAPSGRSTTSDMRPSAALLALTTAVAVLSGCGADTTGDSDDEASAERAVVATINAFNSSGDGATYCAKLTDAGRDYVAQNFAEGGPATSCEQAFGPATEPQPPEKLPKVDPVGVDGDFALAVIQFGGKYPESFVCTLKREDGRWLIDCPCVVPSPDQLGGAVDSDAADFANSPEGREAAGVEETDGDFAPVIAVGDVALAYQSGGAPDLMVNDGNGWHFAPLSVGAY